MLKLVENLNFAFFGSEYQSVAIIEQPIKNLKKLGS